MQQCKKVLFLIDWDDTILPTTWLRNGGYLAGTVVEMENAPKLLTIPPSLAAAIFEIERQALALIEAAEKMGTVIFVTNSSSQWIPFTVKRFVPTLLAPAMNRFEMHSARPEAVERELALSARNVLYVPAMGVNWKCDKFDKLAARSRYTDFVSIGDGMAERVAVLALRRLGCAKAVRLDPQPTITLMIDQLSHLKKFIGGIVHESRSGDITLYTDGYSIDPITDENDLPR